MKTSKRIFIFQSTSGKRKIYVNALTRSRAINYVFDTFFTCRVATHEELMEAFRTEGTEIVDVDGEAVEDTAPAGEQA